jgi:DNA-binding Lrp family transcriptional regulator
MGERAYVLIETVVGRSREVAIELSKWDWVEFVERVTGPYDIVAMVEGYALSEIDRAVNEGLTSVDGIVRVVVCPISAGFQNPIPALPSLVH